VGWLSSVANPRFGAGTEGSATLPIRLLIDNSSKDYLAMDAAVLVEAFECALNELGLADRNDPATLVPRHSDYDSLVDSFG
jgi:hypothetical protein